MNIDDMKNSWLEAVANGEAEGFSRHFVPDILDALEKAEAKLARYEQVESGNAAEHDHQVARALAAETALAAERERAGRLTQSIMLAGKILLTLHQHTTDLCGWEICQALRLIEEAHSFSPSSPDPVEIRTALRDAVELLERGEFPRAPKPRHVHHPDANCDGECVDWERFQDMLSKWRALSSPSPEPEEKP